MKRLAIALALVLIVGVAAACAAPAPSGMGPQQTAPAYTTTAPRPTVVPAPAAPPGGKGSESATAPVPAPSVPGVANSDTTTDTQRMVVRTGQLSLLVEDIAATVDRIVALAKGYKDGYVVSSNTWREGDRLRGSIAIRVPSADFDAAIKAVAALATEVTQQTTTSKDVTEEYTDLSSRLKNLEATEQQLLIIMAKATKIEDVLAIQREITNTRSQIEQTKGRMQYLERTTATSLININLEQAKLDVTFKTTGGRVVLVGDSVRFASQIIGGYSPFSYQWEFGDGEKSTEFTPAHAYQTPGSYTVTLKVTDNRGNTDTETTRDYITVNAPPGWSPGNVAASAWNTLGNFSQGAANVLIWLVIFLSPLWIIGAIGGAIYWSLRRRKQK